MFLFAAALAQAGLREDLVREAGAAPEIAIACSSARDALDRFAAFAAVGTGPEGAPSEMGAFLDALGGVLGPEARLGVAWWQEGSALRIGFDTALDAPGLAGAVAAMVPGRAATVVDDALGLRVRDADGSELAVRVEAGWGEIRNGTIPTRAGRPLPAALLGAIPEEPGCAVAFQGTDKQMGPLDMAFHLPAGGGRAGSYAASVPLLRASSAIRLGGAPPPPSSSPGVPELVAVIGVGLADVEFGAFLEGRELRRARWLQRYYPVAGGTTLALLRTAPTPRVGAVVPFFGSMSARRIAARTRRIARELDLEVEKVDATHSILRLEDVEILAAALPGRLLLATEPSALNALEAGAGEPWLDASLRATAAEWPVVLASRGLMGLVGDGGALPRPLLLTMDIDDGVVKGLVDLPLTPEQLARIGALVDSVRAPLSAPGSAPAR